VGAGGQGDLVVAAEGADVFLDGPAGVLFDPVADGEGGEDDGEVGVDGFAGVVVDRTGA